MSYPYARRKVNNKTLNIGITGPFGSGCSTLRVALQEVGFETISLSEYVRERWKELHPGQAEADATRTELQDIGNELRKEKGNTHLAERSFKDIAKRDGSKNRLVFDSIRHPDEVAFFREKYPSFFLVTVDASLDERWERLKRQYEARGLTIREFREEDKRDAYEDLDYGQKVQLCVDDSDISIWNDKHFGPKHAQKDKLKDKIVSYIKLIEGQDLRSPSPDESMMALAYSIALRSSCYKRQVGAVIVDDKGLLLGAGCNENARPLGSCRDEFGECYRDIFKKEVLEDIQNTECPVCHKILRGNISSELKCKSCDLDLDTYYIKDRALSRCTALHAEESAIINIGGKNLEGCTIYTTTFPCFLCTQKIIACGIREVVYSEPYPDPGSAIIFEIVNSKLIQENKQGITVRKFEGIKARAYFMSFSAGRIQMEEFMKKSKRKENNNG